MSATTQAPSPDEFTERDEIDVALGYLNRVRAMGVSPAALADIEQQEHALRARLRHPDSEQPT